MAEFGLIKSFDIDDGELDHFTPPQCFVLGYELAQIDALLKLRGAISKPVHGANRLRILKSCKDAGREHRLTYMHDDQSEGWMQLDVAALSDESSL